MYDNVICIDCISGEIVGQGSVECATDCGYIVNMDDGTQLAFLDNEVIPIDDYNRR